MANEPSAPSAPKFDALRNLSTVASQEGICAPNEGSHVDTSMRTGNAKPSEEPSVTTFHRPGEDKKQSASYLQSFRPKHTPG